MTIEEAFVELENYTDASDPDLDLVCNSIEWQVGFGLYFAFLHLHFVSLILESTHTAESAPPSSNGRRHTQGRSSWLATAHRSTSWHGQNHGQCFDYNKQLLQKENIF
jgi:hypothetical protein